jgi:hypothetical protein
LDSLSSLGIKSIETKNFGGEDLVIREDFEYKFEGNEGKINQNVIYTVKVSLSENDKIKVESVNSTDYTRAGRGQPNTPTESELNQYAKNLEAVVEWKYKNSPMSIRMAKVVR